MKKIMLVDDDSAIVEAMTLILEDEDYKVVSADGTNVVDKLKEEKPNLLLLDLWLGGKSGKDVVREIKNSKQFDDLPILFVSASRNVDVAVKEVGINGYIAKPFDIKDLLERVKNAII